MKSRISAAILAILFGSIGLENFYLGQWVRGIISILLSWTGIPGVIGIIKGIWWLFISDAEFHVAHC